MRIIARLPDMSVKTAPSSPDVRTPARRADLTARTAATAARATRAADAPRRRAAVGRFPGGSVVVLSVIAAACWAAAWWSDRAREQADQQQRTERLARELTAGADRPEATAP